MSRMIRRATAVSLLALVMAVPVSGQEATPSPTTLPSGDPTTVLAPGMCPTDHRVVALEGSGQAAVPPERVAAPSPTVTSAPTPTPATSAARHAPATSLLRDLGGTWSKLPRSPFAAVNAVALWAGDRMVAIDPASGRTATYDPATHRWEEHQPVPGASEAVTWLFDTIPATAWTGSEVILAGDRLEPDGESEVPVHFAFDPATGRWRTLAASPLADTGSMAWTGELLVEVTRKRHAAAYDPAADCWLVMPDVPPPTLRPDARTTPESTWLADSLHWTGADLVVVVRKPDPGRPFGPVTFDPLAWTWIPGPQAPSAVGLEGFPADGRLLFLGGGTDDSPAVGTYDPTTETWTVDETDCSLSGTFGVWSGRLILEPLTSRRAYDPATGACYRLPKRKDRARYVLDPVWTGREYVVWSGSWGDSGSGRPDGIVYRPPRSAISAEQAQPMNKKLKRAIEARQRYGFDTDPEVVREIMRDPWQPASRKFGFPMTAAEESTIWSMSAKASQAGHVQPRLRKLPTYAGLWQDKTSGGDFAIALTEADPEVLAQIDGWMAGPWRLVIVPFTEKELKRALRRIDRVSERLDPDAILWAAGIDLSAGGLSLMYDPDDVQRMRAREKELEQRIGVPVYISAGRVRDL